jgi:hypothetical protein
MVSLLFVYAVLIGFQVYFALSPVFAHTEYAFDIKPGGTGDFNAGIGIFDPADGQLFHFVTVFMGQVQ